MSDKLMSDLIFKSMNYGKAFDKDSGTWEVYGYMLTAPKVIKTGLTEEEADAWLKLLKG